uniref:Tubulin tyrosine ligase like 8 n=1 Tax=Nothoprocta perdicaria TaxID=30464 RepID=A0A8C6ZTM2_NOTPE
TPKQDKYKLARILAKKAIKEKKIFTICGSYPVVRDILRKKGWVEKRLPHRSGLQDGSIDQSYNCHENAGKNDDIHDLMSRMVKNEEASLFWTVRKDAINCHDLHCDQMLNHFAKTSSFTTKIGLCLNLRNLPWYAQANPHTFFPRCYGICMEDEKQDFIEDFRNTAASGILKWVVNLNAGSRIAQKAEEKSSNTDVHQDKGYECCNEMKVKQLPGKLVDMACLVCETYLEQRQHKDIDKTADCSSVLSEENWNELLRHYYSLVHEGAVICNAYSYVSQCQAVLSKIMSANPQQAIDGNRNIWIIKPGAKSRGRDIVCKDRLDDILRLVQVTQRSSVKENEWVAQKYIETPLLIYNTKFDIRQWFLVTDWNPLTIWFYKESYLRFCTQHFSLDDLDSSIHLCNNSIQKHYQNASNRNALLPYHNMWSSTKFQEYLEKKGHGTVWQNLICPSMKKAIVYTMKMAQESVEARKNSFELYGADFILGQDFKPWLIEINTSPTMFPSTPVTEELCTQVQEDTIKVVLSSKKMGKNKDTGKFELLWKEAPLDLPPFTVTDLLIEGVGIKKTTQKATPFMNVNFIASKISQEKAKNLASYQKREQSMVPLDYDKQHFKTEKEKNTHCKAPVLLKRQLGKQGRVKDVRTKSSGHTDCPSSPVLSVQSIPDQRLLPPINKRKGRKDANIWKIHQASLSFPSTHSINWTLHRSSKISGIFFFLADTGL